MTRVQNLKKRLADFSRSFWLFPTLVIIGLLILTALRINGSSIGMFHKNFYGNTKDSKLVLGEPRQIRSDEWEVTTPFIISQVKNGFPRFNPEVGAGQDMSFALDVPYREWTTLFKPQHWSFFVLPLEYAFAFKWWLLAALLLISCYILTLTVLPKKYLLASLLSISLLFSPFIQWWYQSSTILPIAYGLFIAALGIRLFQLPSRRRYQLWLAAALTYCLICFAFVLYIPFLVPIALVIGGFLVGHILNLIQDAKARQSTLKTLAYFLAPATILAVLFFGLFVQTRGPALEAISKSVYPGHRTEDSGHFSPVRLMGGYFNIQLQDENRAMHALQNQSEDSNFILLFPFLIPALFYTMLQKVRRKRTIDWQVVALCGVGGLFLTRLFVPFSEIIFNTVGLNRIPHNRLLIGFGVLNILIVLLVIARLSGIQKPLPRLIVWGSSALAGIVVVATGLRLHTLAPGYLGSIPKILCAGIIFGLIVWLLLKKRFVPALILLVIFSWLSCYKINPLYQGLGPFTNSELPRTISQIGDHKGSWVVQGDANIENMTHAVGLASVSGVYAYPQLEVWKPISTTPEAMDVYNRYAHVFFTIEPVDTSVHPSGAFFDPPALDAFRVHADACSSFLKERNVAYILSSTELPETMTCIHPIQIIDYPEKKYWIYQIER